MTPLNFEHLTPADQQALLVHTRDLAAALEATLRRYVTAQDGVPVQALLDGAGLFLAWTLDLCTSTLSDSPETHAQVVFRVQTQIAVFAQQARQQRLQHRPQAEGR
jgi:hypothetical protein